MTEKNPKQEEKPKEYICPECNQKTNGYSSHKDGRGKECLIVIDRRGGWRQLGVYDG